MLRWRTCVCVCGGGDWPYQKFQERGGWENFLKGRGDPKKGDSVGKEGDSVGKGGMSGVWSVTNVLTFNYILVIVFLFPLNEGVSHCFHCTILYCAVKARQLFKNVMEGSKAIHKWARRISLFGKKLHFLNDTFSKQF